jgi:hypothetical protein
MYAHRVTLGGWQEEVFCSLLQRARIGAWKPSAKVQAFFDAFSLCPHRAEPLADLAEHFRAQDEHALAFIFAARATELRAPSDESLFVEVDAYQWKPLALAGVSAWYIGEFGRGELFTRNALMCSRLPADWRADLERNLAMYESRK